MARRTDHCSYGPQVQRETWVLLDVDLVCCLDNMLGGGNMFGMVDSLEGRPSPLDLDVMCAATVCYR